MMIISRFKCSKLDHSGLQVAQRDLLYPTYILLHLAQHQPRFFTAICVALVRRKQFMFSMDQIMCPFFEFYFDS